MKIAIVVDGRFHAFDLARSLLQGGHNVTLFTNYPKWAVERFDFPGSRVRSFWAHGVLTRAAQKLHQRKVISYAEERFHTMFGRWAAAGIQKEEWDIVHLWSGVSEEILRALDAITLKLLMRGSAHIRAQARLLEEEERRTGVSQDRPSPWIIAREQREYALADAVVVLSTFSYSTFVAEGFPRKQLRLLPLGASLDQFRPTAQVVEDRCRRILCGEPIRVLNVGAFSFQKGMWDMAAVIRELDKKRFAFRFVGPTATETSALVEELSRCATFIPKQPQAKLPDFYAWGDVFMLPTVQDGFQTVLGQAAASALPILTTPNGAGLDIVQEGETGWVLPIRSPEAFIERLRWCDGHREELVGMVRRIYNDFRPRDWSDVAADFEKICIEGLETKKLEGEKARKLEGAEA
jgi:glycosyltransferase involved in cell wall biosynthesis